MLNPQELTADVKQMALALGADLVGIASPSRYDGAPPKVRPQAHLPEAKAVIVMAVHHLDASVDFGAEPNSNFPGGFQIGMIPKLECCAHAVEQGVKRAFIIDGRVPHSILIEMLTDEGIGTMVTA